MTSSETINDLVIKIQNQFQSRKLELIDENIEEQEFLESENKYWTAFETPIKNQIKNELKELLVDSVFKCYHCTKLTDKSIIKKIGLKALNIRDLNVRVLKEIEPHLTENQKIILNDCFAKYKDGVHGKRENLIWFISNKNLTESIGCKDFFYYFGGEVTRRILADFENDFFSILRKTGKPYIVECQIGFNEIKSNHLDYLIDKIIESLLSGNSEINWEFYLEKDLLPERIIEIYDKEIYAR